MLNLDSNIQFIKGVGEKRAKLFNSLGIFDVDSLIHFYPRKYEDWTVGKTLNDVNDGDTICIKATLITPVKEAVIRRGLTLYKCKFSDGENVIAVTIFNNKYLAKSLKVYEDYFLYGKIDKSFLTASMSSPKIEKADGALAIQPIYPAKEKLTSRAISKVMKTALDEIHQIDETLSDEIMQKYGLISLDKAIRDIHFPSSAEDYLPARKRLIFEELLTLQLGLLKLKSNKKCESSLRITKDYSKEFETFLPFTLTNAQKRTIGECVVDMESKFPCNRLVQGDVGSGKTAVAASLIYTVIKNGYQAAMMVPTEILATQHFESLTKMFSKSDLKIALLTGSTPAKQKREIKKALFNNEIDLLIGTHALIQNDVEFKKLALVITDEQHRFGVRQRTALAEKGEPPNVLVMSATPIPRTLAIILYGDLSISVIDELPAKRLPIKNCVVDTSYRPKAYRFITRQVELGRQAYVICPMVEESEGLEAENVTDYTQLLKKELPGITVEMLHGQMKAAQKNEIMERFASGEIQVLVSTTVVEVGVNVPNATVMMVENAERFGLAQLHQLRGRVGRGEHQSYCIFIRGNKDQETAKRLEILNHSNDGFYIASEDLKLRGSGDLLGTRQSGDMEFQMADIFRDADILQKASEAASELLADDPYFEKPEHELLKKVMKSYLDLENHDIGL